MSVMAGILMIMIVLCQYLYRWKIKFTSLHSTKALVFTVHRADLAWHFLDAPGIRLQLPQLEYFQVKPKPVLVQGIFLWEGKKQKTKTKSKNGKRRRKRKN